MGDLVSCAYLSVSGEAHVQPTADDLEGAIVSIARRLNDAGAVLSQVR